MLYNELDDSIHSDIKLGTTTVDLWGLAAKLFYSKCHRAWSRFAHSVLSDARDCYLWRITVSGRFVFTALLTMANTRTGVSATFLSFSGATMMSDPVAGSAASRADSSTT